MEEKLVKKLCKKIMQSGNSKRVYVSRDRVSTGGTCDAAVTNRKRCRYWLKFREDYKLLHQETLAVRLKMAFYKNYVRLILPALW